MSRQLSCPPSTEANLAAMTARLPEGLTVPVVARTKHGWRIIGTPTAGNLGATIDAIARHRDTCHIYTNANALELDRAHWLQRRNKRGGDVDIAAIVALHGDIDIAGPNHNSDKRYPTTQSAALEILDETPPPSLLLHTGGGLGAWWLLADPVILTADNRAAMTQFVTDWVLTLAHHADLAGWEIDKNSELCKLMRVAGTLNHKADPAQRVLLHDVGGWPSGGLLEHGWSWRPDAVYDVDQLTAVLDPLQPAQPEPKVSARPTRTRSSSGDDLDILDAVDAAPWSDIWPSDWTLMGHGQVKGEPVERWLRPGSHADKSVTCWVNGGCRVFSDAVPGLPQGNYSKAGILAWRLGLAPGGKPDFSELARRITREARAVTA